MSRRSRAAHAGAEQPPVEGVQHIISKAKTLRSHAQSLVKKTKEINDDWWWHERSGCWYDRQARRRWHAEAEREATQAWDHAEAVSWAAGVQFKLRNGDWAP